MRISSEKTQTRRIFLGHAAGNLAGFSLVAGVLRRIRASAQDKQKEVLASLKIADFKALEKVGGFVLVKDTAAGDLLIVRTGDDQYNALSNVCPHRQCRVEVKSPTLIQCPCHQSTYKIDGTYVSGPANKSLKNFRLTAEGGMITVTES